MGHSNVSPIMKVQVLFFLEICILACDKGGIRACAIITWRGGGGWETRGGHRGKSHIEREGGGCKI